MVYRFSNIRTELGFGTMPEESIEYSRKGGCFVSLCRGVCLSFFLLFFITLLLVIVFFSTRHAYEKQAGVSLEEFVRKPSPFIEKTDRLAKLFTPKNYRLVIYPYLNETDDKRLQYSFEGVVWIVFVARRGNIRKIELNIKNLEILEEDVIVYKSFKIPNLRNLSQTYLESTNYMNISHARVKREEEATTDSVSLEEPDVSDAVTESVEGSSESPQASSEDEKITLSSTTTEEPEVTTSSTTPYPCNKNDDEEDDLDDDVTMKKINQVYIDEDDELMIISLDVELRRNIFYTVKVNFKGNMTNDKGLFHKTFGENTDNPSILAGTFTTPESARMILPCFDDDDFQSVFDISIIRSSATKSASNAKLNTTEYIAENLFMDNFHPTPPMPVSELGFIVTNMKSFDLQMNDNLSLQLFTQENNFDKVNKTMVAIQNVVNLIEHYTRVPFNMDELSYVILPHRQNYREIKRGIILTSEYFIPISTDAYLSNQEITHELAFQWFDGINQYELDEEIWLKKAIPLFLQQIALNDKDESDYYEAEYLIFKSKVMQDEMDYKNFRLTRETDEDRLDDDIMNFMQKKGLCVLKMFNYTLSTNVFQEAIAEYFRKRTHNQTVDFYSTLQHSAKKENLSKHLNLQLVFEQWINWDQIPVIMLHKIGNKFIVRQKNLFFEDQKTTENSRIVSLTYKSRHENFDKILWMTKREYCLEKSENDSYVILNPSGNGYYRSNYPEEMWMLIISDLKNNFLDFSSFTRATLIDDAYNLARYGIIPYRIVFRLTSVLMKLETSYLPWKILLGNFDYLYRNMQDFPIFLNLLEYIKTGIEQVTINEELMTSENPNDAKDIVDLKLLLERWLCKFGLSNSTSNKRNEFDIILNENLFPEIQNTEDELFTILCTVITYGGIDEWKRVYDKLLLTHYFSSALVKSLGCTREPALISTYVNFLLSDDQVLRDHHADIINAISENQIMIKFAMEYFYRNWNKLREYYDLQDFFVVFKRLSTEKDFKLLQSLFSKYYSSFVDHDKQIFKHILHSITTTLKWRNKIAVKITADLLLSASFENIV